MINKKKEEEEKTKKSVLRHSSRNKETGKDAGKPQQESSVVPASAPHDDRLKDGLTNVILNPLLTYIVYGLNSGTTSAVKRAVLGHFTDEKVSQAKDILFDNCDKEIIGDKKKRVTTSARSNTEANLDDIIAATQLLCPKRKLPTFAVSACDMPSMPRSHPEEINNISMADRMNRRLSRHSEVLLTKPSQKICKIKEELKELKYAPPSYAAKIKTPSPPSYADKIKTPSSTEGLYYSKPLTVTMPSSSVWPTVTRRRSDSDPTAGSANNKGDVSPSSNINAIPAVPSSQRQNKPTSATTPASQDLLCRFQHYVQYLQIQITCI